MDEHTYGEHWHLDWANSTYYKVAAMLSAPPDTTFKYIEDKHYYDYSKVKIGKEDGTYQWINM
jgi:hypothetical protein